MLVHNCLTRTSFMSHCVSNQTYSINIEDAPISQSRVVCNKNIFTIYLDKRLEKVAPHADAFLRLHAKRFMDLTQKGPSEKDKKDMQNNAVRQIGASLAVLALGLNCSMNCLPATLFSLPVWFLAHKLTNCANERIKTKEVDKKVVEEATPEHLKGGILFYKACQEVNKNKVFFTRSGDSWFPSLESTPTLEDRIHQLEQKLKNQGIDLSHTEEDQKNIKQIENLFYSAV